MVYYNEHDPFAAAWLRELIAAGHIAFGVVDERSIEDVLPAELMQFKQCHFFAGIGVWSYALRRAGIPDDYPIWTGSCPCQPFSAAGKGDGFADERHLWPAFYHLISQCKPKRVIGEQVASKAVDDWIDLVHSDLEAVGYAFGSVPFPSAGVGAPHIRDRNYWLADSNGKQDITTNAGRLYSEFSSASIASWMGDDDDARSQGYGRLGQLDAAEGWKDAPRHYAEAGALGGVADLHRDGCGAGGAIRPDGKEYDAQHGGDASIELPGPTNGLWRDADWLFCRDGKWRPVEPGTFPLVAGSAARVGRLRGYGNALNAEQAQGFIEAYLDATRL